MAKKTGKKGFETEEVVRSYFIGAGFYAIRGVQLAHGGHDLTDIDLWLYERSATLGRRRIIIDIKDNMQPKAAERLFFVKGLAEITRVEAAGVVTSDARQALRELARQHNVLWIDNADLQRLKSSQKLAVSVRLSDEDLKALIDAVDKARASRQLRDIFAGMKSSVANRFGPQSANTALDGAHVFAKLAVEAYPNSDAAKLLTRLTYFSASLAAAALDYTSGDVALRAAQDRMAYLTDAIRFGSDPRSTAEKLRWTEAAVRDFSPNGVALAKSIRDGFTEALNEVPAEGLAETIVKMSNSDRLFEAARRLEAACYAIDLPSFDGLDVDSKSVIGAVLDFVHVDRVRFASSVDETKNVDPETQQYNEDKDQPTAVEDTGAKNEGESKGTLL